MRKDVKDLLRNDLLSFAKKAFKEKNKGRRMPEYRYLELLAVRLAGVVVGDNKRLIVNLPPRHFKTWIGSISLSAWILGRDPSAKILIISYGQELAGSDQPDEALFEFVSRLANEAASKRNLIDALTGAGFDLKATSSDSKEAFEEVFRVLLTRAQSAGLVRDDVQAADLVGLVMGACTLATPERTDCSQARMLAVVFAGLRPESASRTSA